MFLKRLFARRTRRPKVTARPRIRIQLRIEGLEERALMSTGGMTDLLRPTLSHATEPAGLTREALSPIASKYAALGGARSVLGTAVTTERVCPDGVGHYEQFQYGSIYWSPSTGAHELHGAIASKFASLGWERSVLGYPTTDEMSCPDGVGRYEHFSKSGSVGSIYWTTQTGAHEIHGAIRAKWASMGYERSLLGYPTTDETTCPDGVGRFNHFSRGGPGGSIYWTAQTGAHEVHGAIRERWASMGWERATGYPTSDEIDTPDHIGRFSRFQRAEIGWTATVGTMVLTKMTDFSSERTQLATVQGFPNLGGDYEVTAEHTNRYNCIAWSVGVTDKWLWPGDKVSDFDKLYGSYGYHRLSTMDYSVVPGHKKITLYATRNADGSLSCTHGAHQEADGSWSSKLGALARIHHLTPGFVSGSAYGEPIAVYMT